MGGDLTLYIAGDPIPGYLSVPESGGPWPGAVVLHQAFGLDDDIRRITDRVAAMGYLSVAPDLVAGGGWRCIARLFRDLSRGFGENVEKVEAVITWLRSRADCSGKVGAIGFCMGGGYAFLLGSKGQVDVTAPNYGAVPPELASSCPVVGSYGAEDRVTRKGAQRCSHGTGRSRCRPRRQDLSRGRTRLHESERRSPIHRGNRPPANGGGLSPRGGRGCLEKDRSLLCSTSQRRAPAWARVRLCFPSSRS